MGLEAIGALVAGTSSAILLAPAVKKLAESAARGVSLFTRSQSRGTGDAINTPVIHEALGEVDDLLTELEDMVRVQGGGIADHSVVSEADGAITEMVDSIHGLVDEVRELAGPAGAVGEEGGGTGARKAVGEVLGTIAAFGGARRRARVFMSTIQSFDSSGQSYTIKIAGNRGSQQLTFASNVSQSKMIGIFNAFARKTGVMAVKDEKTGYLIELLSFNKGGQYFVAARRVRGAHNNLLYDDTRSHPADLQVDFGEQ